MIILGIDPGIATTGFALLEKEGRTIRIIEYGIVSTPARSDVAERLLLIHRDIEELIDTYHPDVAGLERLFFYRNVTNGIDVAESRGVVVHAIASRGIRIREFTPLQVKQAITGNGQAKKPQMQKAIKMILNMSEIPRPDDAADAIAIAYITALGER